MVTFVAVICRFLLMEIAVRINVMGVSNEESIYLRLGEHFGRPTEMALLPKTAAYLVIRR